MKNKALALTVLSLIFIANASLSSSAFAQPSGALARMEQDDEPGDEGSPREHQRMFEGINLTEQQRAKIKELRGQRGEQKELREKMHQARQALRDLMANDASTKEQILSQVKEVNALENEKSLKRAEMLFAMREILTPEQRKQLRQKMEERRSEWREDRKGGNGGPGPNGKLRERLHDRMGERIGAQR